MTMDDTAKDPTSSTNISCIALEMKRKNKLGRKARRKKKKAAAIEAVVSLHENGVPSSYTSTAKILPGDRDCPWPSAMEVCSLTEEDNVALVAQLGYVPGNAISVAAKVSDVFPTFNKEDSSPLVLKLYPLVLRKESDSTKSRRKRRRHVEGADDSLVEPFPTMFWVTHIRFKALISKIELRNLGTEYEKKLLNDPLLMEMMSRAHRAYGEERQAMISPEDRDYISNRGWDRALDGSKGVAGIRNHAAIKCLHAHAAHFWSGCQDNVVGKWVSEEVVALLNEQAERADPLLPQPSSNANE